MAKQGTYWRNLGEAISQLGSALVGKDPDLTISYYVGRAQANGRWWATPIAAVIDWIFNDPNHCENAYLTKT